MAKGREWTSRNVPTPPMFADSDIETDVLMSAWNEHRAVVVALEEAEQAEERARDQRRLANVRIRHYQDLLEELGGQTTIPMPGERDDA